ncbi:MAG: ROK family protein [Chloroflexi bacterium]|nr:ROK family protein [Chloroflexota bacterium]
MKIFAGVDLGGTNLRVGIVDVETGSVLASRTAPTLAREGPEAVMGRMAELIRAATSDTPAKAGRVEAVGIGVPGVLDLKQGLVLFLPNLPTTWPDVPLAATISAQVGLPVFLLNDVRAITLGEWKFGAGRGVDTMACFAVGTGIGGGLVINGKLHLGIGGTAGELGHQTIDINGPVCGCGNRGCLEVFASGPAIAAMGIKAVIQGLTTSIGKLVDYDLNKITPELICKAARQGDAVAKDIYDQAGTYLGVGVANVLVSVGPRKVVIAGGVAAAGDLLLEPVRRTIRERVTIMPVEKVEVVPAELDLNAGVLGSALWAAQNVGYTD